MSNAILEFTCVHRNLVIELPDRSRYAMRVHFAMMTFYVVKEICDVVGIRHAEELSLLKSPFDKEGYVKSTGFHRAKVKKQGREGSPLEGVDTSTPPGSPSSSQKTRLPNALNSEVEGGMESGAVIIQKILDGPENGFFSEKLNRSPTERAFINGL
jgi:kindlin 2